MTSTLSSVGSSTSQDRTEPYGFEALRLGTRGGLPSSSINSAPSARPRTHTGEERHHDLHRHRSWSRITWPHPHRRTTALPLPTSSSSHGTLSCWCHSRTGEMYHGCSCDRYGCSVDTELIDLDCYHYAPDSAFLVNGHAILHGCGQIIARGRTPKLNGHRCRWRR